MFYCRVKLSPFNIHNSRFAQCKASPSYVRPTYPAIFLLVCIVALWKPTHQPATDVSLPVPFQFGSLFLNVGYACFRAQRLLCVPSLFGKIMRFLIRDHVCAHLVRIGRIVSTCFRLSVFFNIFKKPFYDVSFSKSVFNDDAYQIEQVPKWQAYGEHTCLETVVGTS